MREVHVTEMAADFTSRCRRCAFYGVIGVLFVVPYTLDLWWKFLPTLTAIFLLMRLKTRAHVVELGLAATKLQTLCAFCVFVVTIAVASFLVPRLLKSAGIELYHGPDWHLGWTLMPLTQALAEELVLRALLLNGLLLLFQNGKVVSSFAAGTFVFWHFVFFPYAQGVWLSATTLATLFLFGYSSNIFFLAYRSIAIPFALHCGWNIVKFGGEYLDKTTQQRLPEALAFNAVEGSYLILLLAAGLVIISELVMWSKTRRHGIIEGSRSTGKEDPQGGRCRVGQRR